MTPALCSVCGFRVFRDRSGRIVLHTTPATGGTRVNGDVMFASPYTAAKICEGSRA